MKSQVLHTVWWAEAAGEIWNWSLLGMKGLRRKARLVLTVNRPYSGPETLIVFTPLVWYSATQIKRPEGSRLTWCVMPSEKHWHPWIKTSMLIQHFSFARIVIALYLLYLCNLHSILRLLTANVTGTPSLPSPSSSLSPSSAPHPYPSVSCCYPRAHDPHSVLSLLPQVPPFHSNVSRKEDEVRIGDGAEHHKRTQRLLFGCIITVRTCPRTYYICFSLFVQLWW